jgi:hypothetical protein
MKLLAHSAQDEKLSLTQSSDPVDIDKGFDVELNKSVLFLAFSWYL